MINRIVGRLIKLSNINTLKYYFSSDDYKKGGKGGKGKFFGKKDKYKDDLIPFQSYELEEKKETHQKTVKFLKKHDLKIKNIEAQPKKQLRFRKKQTYDQAETRKPFSFKRPQHQEIEQQLVKKSVFVSKAQEQSSNTSLPTFTGGSSSSLPQLNQYLTSPPPNNKFYDKFSEDLDRILSHFQNKNWKELKDIAHGYSQYASALQIQKELHTFLINNNPSSYFDWLRITGKDFQEISDATLKKLYKALVRQYRVKELKELLTYFKSRDFDVEYKSIDILLKDIEKDSPLAGLEAKVNQKIDVILDILSVQLAFNQKYQATTKVIAYTLDEWFNKLAHLALNRKVSKAKFISLFEEIFIKHYEYINLDHLYANGLFYDVVQAYYFGSYATSSKLLALFQDSMQSGELETILLKLRDKMIAYRTRHAKFPFPNAKGLLASFQHYFAEEKYSETIFFFLLLNFSNQPRDINSLMQKRKILINVAEQQYEAREILDDPLLTIDPSLLQHAQVDPNAQYELHSPVTLLLKEINQISQLKEDEQEEWEAKLEAEMQAEELKLQRMSKKKSKNTANIFKKEEKEEEIHVPWAESKIERDYKEELPVNLGWKDYDDGYYSAITKELENEGNVYRRELLYNILKAKLNLLNDENRFEGEESEKESDQSSLDFLVKKQIHQYEVSQLKQLNSTEQEQIFQQIGQLIANGANIQLSPEELQEIDSQERPHLPRPKFKAASATPAVEDQSQESSEFTSSEHSEQENEEGQKQKQSQQDEDEEEYSVDQQLKLLGEQSCRVDMHEVDQDKIKYENLLAIKSAIKLKKYELAHVLCEKIIMEPLIHQRTTRNITAAVKLFLTEEASKEKIPNIHDIIEQVDSAVQNLQEKYIRSVYDRLENFDELIWNYMPPKKHKFEYWETTLSMDRGKELVQMDISGKLKAMQYEPEYDVVPPREKDQYIKNNPKLWRRKLMDELGIMEGEYTKPLPITVETFQNEQEVYQALVEPFFIDEEEDLPVLNQIIRERSGAAHEQLEAQPEQQQEEAEAAEGEAVEEAAAEGEAAEGEAEAVAVEEAVQEQAAVEAGQQAHAEQNVEALQTSQEIKSEHHEQRQPQDFHQQQSTNATNLRIKGYDFTSFMELARTQIKPNLEKNYEQEKEYIKHVINLHSLTEEAMLADVHYLQNKIFQYQRHVKSIHNIAIFASFGLWNFNFVQYAFQPEMARAAAKEFRQKFYNFKKYDGMKGASDGITLDNEKVLDFFGRGHLIVNLLLTEALIDNLLIRRLRLFKQAEAVVRLQPEPVVQELMMWGLSSDEPMAIYLAEKIAMLTNQVISHEVAKQVGNYLSHKREIPAERIDRCKEALRVVGRINRDHIYDLHQEYQHITVRKQLADYVDKRSVELDSSALEFLSRIDPVHSHQPESISLTNNLSRGKLVV